LTKQFRNLRLAFDAFILVMLIAVATIVWVRSAIVEAVRHSPNKQLSLPFGHGLTMWPPTRRWVGWGGPLLEIVEYDGNIYLSGDVFRDYALIGVAAAGLGGVFLVSAWRKRHVKLALMSLLISLAYGIAFKPWKAFPGLGIEAFRQLSPETMFWVWWIRAAGVLLAMIVGSNLVAILGMVLTRNQPDQERREVRGHNLSR
jgi:hypothetical protein